MQNDKIKEHITAGCFLLRKAGSSWEILLIYKKWSEDNQAWVPPKGHVEQGESLEQAALRETKEETGYIDFKMVKYLSVNNVVFPWNDGFTHKKAIHWFLAYLTSDKQTSQKLTLEEKANTIEQKWFSLPDALENMRFEDEKKTLEEVMQFLETSSVQ